MEQKHTPLMQQYHDIKQQYGDALVFFQVGDFYELFYDDAHKAASFLGITLTARGKNQGEPIPLCGVPVHAKHHYAAKLVKGGFNVAICEQLEPPTPGTVVKRGVTEVLTPSTLTDGALLDEKKSSYLFSFFPHNNQCGLIFGELLTAQLFATTFSVDDTHKIEAELSRFFPDEIVMPNSPAGKSFCATFKKLGYTTMLIDQEAYADQREQADAWIQKQFEHSTVDVLEQNAALKSALYFFYAYVGRNQRAALAQFKQLNLYSPDEFLMLDATTQRNLELIRNNRDGSTRNTLFSVLDMAQTPMGSRLLRKWIVRPLIKHQSIQQRHDVIAHFVQHPIVLHAVAKHIRRIGDIERVVGRIALDRAQLHDYRALQTALSTLPELLHALRTASDIFLVHVIMQHCQNFQALHVLLDGAINQDTSVSWLIKKGFDHELDTLRELIDGSTQKLLEFELEEQNKTGIQSLKVRYNQVHGYYIEVTKTNAHRVPDYYTRKQTLVGKERYVTDELYRLQYSIEHAKNAVDAREAKVFASVKDEVYASVSQLRKLSYAVCNLDALCALSTVAQDNNYVRPTFNTTRTITIQAGRHPVVERGMTHQFIPNNTTLCDAERLCIITGPNMGGKSTYLRQVALITILAQMGAYVPADAADMPIVDRIFTRIGAGDNVAEGKSTFLVEMEETATICKYATRNSLVILDEVGRGTSTFDGLAIAQAVIEYIYTTIGANCLFATHYHELTHLPQTYPGIVNYHASSTATAHTIVFLYTIARGAAQGSFGIEAGKFADLPKEVVARAYQVMSELQNTTATQGERVFVPATQAAVCTHPRVPEGTEDVVQKLQKLDCDNLSPRQALDLLWELKKTLKW